MNAAPPHIRQRYGVFSLLVFGGALFVLLQLGMASGGDMQATREAALRAEAERADRALDGPRSDLSGLEVPPWKGGSDLPRRIHDVESAVVLVSFWASYCPPCVREWPSMMELARQLGPEKMKIVAVSYDEDWEAVEQFFRANYGKLPDPEQVLLYRDPVEKTEDMLKTAFGTDKIPETYVVMNGRILYRFVNERNWMSAAMVRFFERLMDGRP